MRTPGCGDAAACTPVTPGSDPPPPVFSFACRSHLLDPTLGPTLGPSLARRARAATVTGTGCGSGVACGIVLGGAGSGATGLGTWIVASLGDFTTGATPGSGRCPS